VVAEANGGGTMHACVGLTLSSCADGYAPSSDPVSYISLFKKNIVVTRLTDISRPITTMEHQRWVRPAITIVQ
jgi:hypothetical protein